MTRIWLNDCLMPRWYEIKQTGYEQCAGTLNLTPEADVAFHKWIEVPGQQDGLASAILADWICDNPQHVRGEPAVVLAFTAMLRSRLYDPENNYADPVRV